MFQLYSKGCEYAIKALIQMKDANQNYSAKAVCKRARIPESYSRKIFQSLVGGGFLEAISGPGGGYRLKDDPKKVSVLDIVHAVDGKNAFDQCVMGFSKCGEQSPCSLHRSWINAKTSLIHNLEIKKLQDLINTENKKDNGTHRKGRNHHEI